MASSSLKKDLDWVKELIHLTSENYASGNPCVKWLKAPHIDSTTKDRYAILISKFELSDVERLILIFSIIPTIAPEYLDPLLIQNPKTGKIFTEFGGNYLGSSDQFFPTGDTAVLFISKGNINERVKAIGFFKPESPLIHHRLISLEHPDSGLPLLSGLLTPSEELIYEIVYEQTFRPTFRSSFPAELLTIELDWNDLILSYYTHRDLEELEAWLHHHRRLEEMPDVSKKFKRGYRALFYGPSGTGKTLTATLIGKKYQQEVYRIDLSMLVSKYIGETEKNLKNVFDIAENKDWILFFDEADSIFGKRTTTSSSNDRYANQEVSYLLQRIEDYPGLIILASNFRANMDKAFQRRFQSMVHFPTPSVEERHQLWKNTFSRGFKLDDSIDLRKVSQKHELTGAAISNILRYCTLMAIKENDQIISEETLTEGIRREFRKEGKNT